MFDILKIILLVLCLHTVYSLMCYYCEPQEQCDFSSPVNRFMNCVNPILPQDFTDKMESFEWMAYAKAKNNKRTDDFECYMITGGFAGRREETGTESFSGCIRKIENFDVCSNISSLFDHLKFRASFCETCDNDLCNSWRSLQNYASNAPKKKNILIFYVLLNFYINIQT